MNQRVERPASPVEGLYYPTPVTPEDAFQAIGRLRLEARNEIDRLIRFLDKTDDYVSRELEVEEGNDEPDFDGEPSLGWTEHEGRFNRHTSTDPSSIDCEDEHDGAEPTEDFEPSLGSINPLVSGSQQTWGAGGGADLEDEHDGWEVR